MKIDDALLKLRALGYAEEAHAAVVELDRLREALSPFAEFARKFDARPLRGIADEFYGIHAGTPYEASLRISNCRTALKALSEESKEIDHRRKHK